MKKKHGNWKALNSFTDILELNVELSIELKSKDNFFSVMDSGGGNLRSRENYK